MRLFHAMKAIFFTTGEPLRNPSSSSCSSELMKLPLRCRVWAGRNSELNTFLLLTPLFFSTDLLPFSLPCQATWQTGATAWARRSHFWQRRVSGVLKLISAGRKKQNFSKKQISNILKTTHSYQCLGTQLNCFYIRRISLCSTQHLLHLIIFSWNLWLLFWQWQPAKQNPFLQKSAFLPLKQELNSKAKTHPDPKTPLCLVGFYSRK